MGSLLAYNLAVMHFKNAMLSALLIEIAFELIPAAKELSA
jgi:hypothetical protein